MSGKDGKLLWWQAGVVYQIYPRSFGDSTGNGVGDLAGILQKLDYLASTLGVDAIWLSPFYPSPMADFGYDVSDYCNVDPLFGDLATFDRLVKEAHGRDLKIIIDFVPNHSSDQHAWFRESRSSRTNPRRDWYVWRDPKPDGSPPNNWLSVFGGPAWEWDPTTEQYYLHSFLKEQPDLNWRNPELKGAMLDAMRFWLDRGVDGFRIDVAHFIMKDPQERDNPPNPDAKPMAHKALGEYDSLIHLHDLGHPDTHGVFREIRALLDEYSSDRPRMSVGEIHVFDWNEWAKYYGKDLDELHMPFNFALLKTEWTAAGVRCVVDELESAIPDGAWPNYVLGNHDDKRMATRLGEAASRQAAVLLLTVRGTPTLFYGDELGMREAEIPADRQQDPWGINVPGLGRDGCRTPMQWTAGPGAGFTNAPEPWLPVSADYKTRNVETQLADPDSHLNLYRRMLGFRRRSDALREGDYRPVEDVPESCFVFERVHPDDTVLVGVNFSDQPAHVRAVHGVVAVSTHRSKEGGSAGGSLSLDPWEAAVVNLN